MRLLDQIDEFLSVMHIELPVKMAHVRIHRTSRQAELLTNSRRRPSLGDKQHDLFLSVGEAELSLQLPTPIVKRPALEMAAAK